MMMMMIPRCDIRNWGIWACNLVDGNGTDDDDVLFLSLDVYDTSLSLSSLLLPYKEFSLWFDGDNDDFDDDRNGNDDDDVAILVGDDEEDDNDDGSGPCTVYKHNSITNSFNKLTVLLLLSLSLSKILFKIALPSLLSFDDKNSLNIPYDYDDDDDDDDDL